MINIGYLFYKEYFSSLKIDKSSGVATFDGKRSLDKLKSLTLKEYKNYTNYLTGEYADKNKIINLTTTYPGLLIGSGYIHEIGGKEKKEKEYLVKNELKLGFYFDHTTGLPVIPASSVKGLLRSAFEKAKGEYVKELLKEELKIKNTDSINVTDLEKSIFEGEENQSLYQRDIFFDAFPIGKINDGNFLDNDYITPHDKPLKSPTPIQFLKVLPNINFQFNFSLKDSGGLTAEQKIKLFKHILLDLGIGAKTNVGYGQLIVDPKIEKQEKIAEENKKAEEIAKAIEEKRIEDEKQRDEKIKLDAENLAKRQQANKDKANQSLEISLKEITDFNRGKKIIEKYSENNNLDTQVEFIKQFVINSYKTEITNNKKKRNWIKKGKQNWYKISKWLEEDTANELFKNLSEK